jgi:hypothetical protein
MHDFVASVLHLIIHDFASDNIVPHARMTTIYHFDIKNDNPIDGSKIGLQLFCGYNISIQCRHIRQDKFIMLLKS